MATKIEQQDQEPKGHDASHRLVVVATVAALAAAIAAVVSAAADIAPFFN